MFVFLWLCVICSVLWLCCCVTVKPAKQLNLQLGGQCDTNRQHCAEHGSVTELFLPVHQSENSSGVLRCSFLIFSVFLSSPPPPKDTWQCCLSPFRTYILFVKSHLRCTSVLSSLLFWFALCVCRGRAPNLNKRSSGITTDPPVPVLPRCFAW